MWGGLVLSNIVETSPPSRAPNGRLLPGVKLNPKGLGGRPSLPEWFRDAGPLALKHLVDVATGVEPVEPELRFKAAALVVDRIYGKAPETVTLEGELAISRIVRTIVDPKDNG